MRSLLSVAIFGFLIVLSLQSPIAASANFPEKANLEFPCFVRYEPDSALGQMITGRNKGKPGGLYSYFLVPPMAKELNWSVVKDDRGVVFCTGTTWGDGIGRFLGEDQSGRHALWVSEDGKEVYLYDHSANELVHVWSKLEADRGFDELWINHINQVAWGDRVYESVESDDGVFVIDRPVPMTYEEAELRAASYKSLSLPAGVFEIPSTHEASMAVNFGASYLLPAMQVEAGQRHDIVFWLSRESDENHKTIRFLNGSDALVGSEYFAFRGKGKEFFVRYVIRGEKLQELQRQGVLPVQRTLDEIMASPAKE